MRGNYYSLWMVIFLKTLENILFLVVFRSPFVLSRYFFVLSRYFLEWWTQNKNKLILIIIHLLLLLTILFYLLSFTLTKVKREKRNLEKPTWRREPLFISPWFSKLQQKLLSLDQRKYCLIRLQYICHTRLSLK